MDEITYLSYQDKLNDWHRGTVMSGGAQVI